MTITAVRKQLLGLGTIKEVWGQDLAAGAPGGGGVAIFLPLGLTEYTKFMMRRPGQGRLSLPLELQ